MNEKINSGRKGIEGLKIYKQVIRTQKGIPRFESWLESSLGFLFFARAKMDFFCFFGMTVGKTLCKTPLFFQLCSSKAFIFFGRMDFFCRTVVAFANRCLCKKKFGKGSKDFAKNGKGKTAKT